ncbi:MAG: UDPGP type 1 family protein [Kiritimatiellia bacterium]
MNYEECRNLLEKHGQSHVLKFWDTLNEDEQEKLLAQVDSIDFDEVSATQEAVKSRGASGTGGDIEPAPVLARNDIDREKAGKAGEEVIRAGQAAALVVAGGQGTRLGFDGPKGCYPAGPVTERSLFEIHAGKLRALELKYGVAVPFYVMTSTTNDAETKAFFEEHEFFGIDPAKVTFFKQGEWPALTAEGKLILESPSRIFMSPDGHGGVIGALQRNCCLEDMRKNGVIYVFYFQVDNPLVEVADPVFMGLHKRRGSEMSLKVCAKRDPSEGLGVVARQNGRNRVVEYTELTEEQKNARTSDGRLKFLFGSVAIHIFSVDFLEKTAGLDLPIHIAHKKVPYCDDHGNTVTPEESNAFKFEKFVFDALPMAKQSLNVEFAREEEFSPIKNAEGNDSPETACRDMSMKYARRLAACGVDVPTDSSGVPLYNIEIDPYCAIDREELCRKIGKGLKVEGDIVLK